MIERGANVNQVSSFGETPLWIAASVLYYFVFCILWLKNVFVIVIMRFIAYKYFIHKYKFLLIVCFFLLLLKYKAGHEEVARLLIDHGAIVDKADHKGQTPLWAAAEV